MDRGACGKEMLGSRGQFFANFQSIPSLLLSALGLVLESITAPPRSILFVPQRRAIGSFKKPPLLGRIISFTDLDVGYSNQP